MQNKEFLTSLWLSGSSIDEELFLQTLTHKSFAMDYATWEVEYNERLEFMGDAILWAVIAKLLFDNFPDLHESELTLSKIFLVKETTLAKVARNIGLGDVMRIWTGEERSWWRDKESVLSDWLEALIAFIYIQYWRPTVEEFITMHVYTLLWDEAIMPQKSWKNQLQELVQKYHNEIPIYEDIELEIDDTGDVKLFWADVYVLNTLICRWTWTNKKKAQDQWAMKAMDLLEVVDWEVKLRN